MLSRRSLFAGAGAAAVAVAFTPGNDFYPTPAWATGGAVDTAPALVGEFASEMVVPLHLPLPAWLEAFPTTLADWNNEHFDRFADWWGEPHHPEQAWMVGNTAVAAHWHEYRAGLYGEKA